MQAVAVARQMYKITHNPFDLGLVGLVQFIPAALFVLVAGHVADRYDRRMIVRICQMTSALAAATLAIGTVGGWMTAGIAPRHRFRDRFGARLRADLPGIVPLSLLPRATAAGASATQIAVISKPALGGFLYAVSPVLVYGLCCTLYITSSFLISRVSRSTATRVHASRSAWRYCSPASLHQVQSGHSRDHHARSVRRHRWRRLRAAAGVRPRCVSR
jgi:hypothetical protein